MADKPKKKIPSPVSTAIIDVRQLEKAHEDAVRTEMLERARAGQSVTEWKDGKLIVLTPAQIFARYGFDAKGNPKESKTPT